MKSVETTFAPDSSGFRTTMFNEYCKQKHGTDKTHKWVKAHILIGTKTNIIASVRITGENGADSPQFKPMVTEAYENGFEIKEIPADKGYSSRENYEAVNSVGAKAYIPFRRNATGKSRGSMLWRKMYHYFMLNREEFLQHYHKRSNVEAVFHSIKAKFGSSVRSKNKTAQINEILLKILCYNLCCVIQEMHELGISADFCTQSQTSAPKVDDI